MPAVPDTWFLLRGLTREAGHWGRFVPDLRAALPDANIHTIDLPGAGAHHRVAWPETVHAAMEHVRADAERIAPRAQRGRTFVFALSLGGMITIEWAARYPRELTGVVIGGTSSGRLSPFYQRARPGAWWRMIAAGVGPPGARRERGILAMVSTRRDLHQETSISWAEIARLRPMSRAATTGQLLAAIRWRAPATAPRVPMLLLVGDGDRMVHPDCSRQLAARWRVPLAVHASAGHELTLDAGDWVVEQLVRFAASQPRDHVHEQQ